MQDFLKANTMKLLLIIPAILTITGTIIINLSITKYGIEDFYFITTKNFITGITFFALNIALVYHYLIVFDGIKMARKSIKGCYYNIILMFLYIISALTLLEIITGVFSLPDISFWHFLTTAIFLVVITAIPFFIRNNEEKLNKSNNTIHSRRKIFLVLVSSLLFIIVIAVLFVIFVAYSTKLLLLSKNYREIIQYSLFMSIICNLTIHCVFISDEEMKLEKWKNQDPLIPLDGRLFVIVIAVVFLITSYSKLLYPNLSASYGGGNYSNQLLISHKNNTTHKGKIIHYNQDSIFLKIDEYTISKSKLDDINSIKYLEENNKKESALGKLYLKINGEI